jgi:vitamin B12/bleomycin/antimicrobial peptide transport system ATP-binding/permease protein
MDAQPIPLKTTGTRFVRAVRAFAKSEVGWKAKLIFAALVLLLLAANALNVANSFVGRNFMTAIADRDMPGFIRQAFTYVGVFAALTLVAAVSRFGEERLGLLWRDTMTRGIVRRYLADGNYQKVSGAVANPDQRISEDVRAFTVTSLSFTLMGLTAPLPSQLSPRFYGPSARCCSASPCFTRPAARCSRLCSGAR